MNIPVDQLDPFSRKLRSKSNRPKSKKARAQSGVVKPPSTGPPEPQQIAAKGVLILLRFRDLKERGIVNSWPQLKRLQTDHDFPLGRMLSPNIRAWTEEEIQTWFESRPIENARPLQGAPKAKREARKRREREGATMD